MRTIAPSASAFVTHSPRWRRASIPSSSQIPRSARLAASVLIQPVSLSTVAGIDAGVREDRADGTFALLGADAEQVGLEERRAQLLLAALPHSALRQLGRVAHPTRGYPTPQRRRRRKRRRRSDVREDLDARAAAESVGRQGAHVGEHRVRPGGNDERSVRAPPRSRARARGRPGRTRDPLRPGGPPGDARAHCATGRAPPRRPAPTHAATSSGIGRSVGARSPRKRCVAARRAVGDASRDDRTRDAERAADDGDDDVTRRSCAPPESPHRAARRPGTRLPSGSVASASAAPPAFFTSSCQGVSPTSLASTK